MQLAMGMILLFRQCNYKCTMGIRSEEVEMLKHLSLVYRLPDKSKIPEFIIKLNEILSSTSQSAHEFIVGSLILTFLIPLP